MEIDFNEAPDGATHYLVCDEGEIFWYKKINAVCLHYLSNGFWRNWRESNYWGELKPIPPKTQKIQFIQRAEQLGAEAAGGEFNDVSFGALFDSDCQK